MNPYVVPHGFAIIPPSAAGWLLALAEEGRKVARRDTVTLPAEVEQILKALELIRPGGGDSMGAAVPQIRREAWISTAEAAGSLCVSHERVRQYGYRDVIATKKVAGNRYFDADDVRSLMELRNAPGGLRNPSSGTGGKVAA